MLKSKQSVEELRQITKKMFRIAGLGTLQVPRSNEILYNKRPSHKEMGHKPSW